MRIYVHVYALVRAYILLYMHVCLANRAPYLQRRESNALDALPLRDGGKGQRSIHKGTHAVLTRVLTQYSRGYSRSTHEGTHAVLTRVLTQYFATAVAIRTNAASCDSAHASACV